MPAPVMVMVISLSLVQFPFHLFIKRLKETIEQKLQSPDNSSKNQALKLRKIDGLTRIRKAGLNNSKAKPKRQIVRDRGR